jgi:hypothetical protein
MISKDKQYRTRDGREVRIYATDGHPDEPVHGAFKDNAGLWNQTIWRLDGTCRFGKTVSGASCTDIIEVKPCIKREYWANVYPNTVCLYPDKESASDYAYAERLACVKIVINCEEGEGL